ncbi:MAG: hypothetical protein AB8H80_05885, partial [Planctomycetota bacterium]
PNQALSLLAAASLTGLLSAQSVDVVPDEFTNVDAIRMLHVPGISGEWRHQILIGAQHLNAMLGHQITALEYRRSKSTYALPATSGNATVALSIAPSSPIACSAQFAVNAGTTPTQVFQGTVLAPASPAEPGPNIAWDADNTVRIQFQQSFVYAGGTLCIDITGANLPGQEPKWWPIDATLEDLPGTTTDLGGGCGIYGGQTSAWSHVEARSLVPGGNADMHANGTPGSLAICAIGTPNAAGGVSLAMLGFPAPAGCELKLATMDLLFATTFVPATHPLFAAAGGRADVSIPLPAIPEAIGFSLATQWLDWSQSASSNAIEWTVASAIPSLDMAIVEGHPSEASGNRYVYMAPVLRFEHQ